MRFDSGPEGFVRVNRHYVLSEYVPNKMTVCNVKMGVHSDLDRYLWADICVFHSVGIR